MFTAGQAVTMLIFMILFFGFLFNIICSISLYKKNKKLFIAYYVGIAIVSSLFAYGFHPYERNVLYYTVSYFILLSGAGFGWGLIEITSFTGTNDDY